MSAKIIREILFRGKRTDNGEWVKGYVGTAFTIDENRKVKSRNFTALDCLGCSSHVIVLDETVGQYTGLKDKNGVKIFEGDIAITKTTSSEFVGCISYSTEYVRFVCTTKSKIPYPMDKMFEYEVIGNIHDNPELLETAAKIADKNIAQSGLAPATENFELMEV